MPENKWSELFHFTSNCKYLIKLEATFLKIGEAGNYLAQSITSWGDDPPLQELNLSRCSMPKKVWPELLQSLSSCKQLTDLDLSYNNIGEAGRYLAQSITSWGDNSPLNNLYLNACSIPEQVWPELLQSLSSCKQLSHLDLADNIIGEAGSYLAQSITSWGDNPPLEQLHLDNCSIQEQVCPELLQSLSSFKKLTHLDLWGNTIGEAGRYLRQSITSWGDNPPLECLDLSYCSIPQQVWPELLQCLSYCRNLSELNLYRNTLTGCLSSFLSNPNQELASLLYFDLRYTAINQADVQHLTNLIENNGLPALKNLSLREENWVNSNNELELLKTACCAKIDSLYLNLDEQITSETQLDQHIQPSPETTLSWVSLREEGHYLSDFIQQQGDNPPLEELRLYNHDMPESKWAELFHFTSTCKYMNRIDLSWSNLGESGHYLAQSITSWGNNPPLELLNLSDCSIPEQLWPELLQSLSSCKRLSKLNLSYNNIGEAGRYLAQSIKSWGDNPPLELSQGILHLNIVNIAPANEPWKGEAWGLNAK